MTVRQWVLVLGTVLGSLSCGSSGDEARDSTPSPLLELHVVRDEQECDRDCAQIEFDSLLQGTMVLWVNRRPDLVLSPGDITSIVPVELSAVSIERPRAVIWTGTLILTPQASRQLRELASGLSAYDRILVSSGGEPLSVSYAEWLGQMMGVGEFPSLEELKQLLGQYAEVVQGSGEKIEVFSPEELEAERQRQQHIEQSERMRSETERIQKLAEEGKISRKEMVKRLVELGNKAANE